MNLAPNRTGRILAAYNAHDIPRTRPAKPVAINLATLDEFNRSIQRARADYYLHPFATCNHKPQHTAASLLRGVT